MEIENLSKDMFVLKKSNAPFANTMRRIMMNEVPTMAIDTVEISKNSGILYDEILAHRMGLLVLKTDLKSYNLPDKCTCKGAGCAQCQLKLTLKAKGPGYVYAGTMESQDPKVKPVHEKTIITKLLKGQEIELIATAILGKGKDHTKWSPGLVHYKHPVEIEVKNPDKDVESIVKSCPKCIFEDKGGKVTVNKNKVVDCHLCLSCVEASKNKVKITENTDSFIFTVEPWGQLDTKTIVSKGVSVIADKCDEFVKKVKEL